MCSVTGLVTDIGSGNYYLFCMCSFSSFSAAAVKKLKAILVRFTGLFHSTEKKCVAFLPHLHYVRLSSKPNTSALKQVLGGCHGYKVTLWAWPSIEVFCSPSLARWKFTWPNCQSQAFMTSKPGRIQGSSETFVRWQWAEFLKPCWHSQFASRTLATSKVRLLHFENRHSHLTPGSDHHYAKKGPISLI